MQNTYKNAGVDKEEGYRTVNKIKEAVSATHNANVLNGIGSFGAFYQLPAYKNPVLVSGTDGVGTKIRIALDVKKYNTVGQDCVAMCVNDILCHGAKPLFFLDYLACGKLDSDVAAEIVVGIANACKSIDTALIGGETAEMPGMYQTGDYDLAGFAVGIVEKDAIIDGAKIAEGNVLIALPSSGFHSNGFSLVRKIFPDFNEEWQGKPLYETLLTPTELYINPVQAALKEIELHGIAHITGGGLIENVPRIIPDGLTAEVDTNKIKVPAIMQELQKRGNIALAEMYGAFNMGIGMVLVARAEDQNRLLQILQENGVNAYPIGKITKGAEKIELSGL